MTRLDRLTMALYRFVALRCAARGLRPPLLCQHVRVEPVAPARTRIKRPRRKPPEMPSAGLATIGWRPVKADGITTNTVGDASFGRAHDHIGDYGE